MWDDSGEEEEASKSSVAIKMNPHYRVKKKKKAWMWRWVGNLLELHGWTASNVVFKLCLIFKAFLRGKFRAPQKWLKSKTNIMFSCSAMLTTLHELPTYIISLMTDRALCSVFLSFKNKKSTTNICLTSSEFQSAEQCELIKTFYVCIKCACWWDKRRTNYANQQTAVDLTSSKKCSRIFF